MDRVNEKPLVSVMTPNYNHSRFLDQCIQSVLDQTYANIEHIILDNQSEDDSVSVAAKYVKDGVRICRNPINFMNYSYRVLSELLVAKESKYMMLLPADDYLEPSFIEKCVGIMEAHESIGYVHAERDFVTEDSAVIELEPFFNCSFLAPGKNMMPLYTITTVAHPAQGIYRKSTFFNIEGYDQVIDHMNADKTLWFYLSSVSDYAYIREKLVNVRIGQNTDTYLTQCNFQHPFLCYLTLDNFHQYADMCDLQTVLLRKNDAYEKMSIEFLSTAASFIKNNNFTLARRYLAFCEMINENVVFNKTYQLLSNAIDTGTLPDDIDQFVFLEKPKKRNYLPPEGYVPISI